MGAGGRRGDGGGVQRRQAALLAGRRPVPRRPHRTRPHHAQHRRHAPARVPADAARLRAVKAAIPSVDGGSIHWRVADIAEPKPGPAQLLVRVKAASINRGESVLLRTKLPAGAGGIDAAGEVVAVGANVQRFKPGDRVAGRCAGGFAELAAMNEFEAMPLPRELGYEEAACLPVSFTVAHDALVVNGRLAKGETVLITGVSSAVGVAALAIAKFLGAMVIGTSRSPEKLAKLKSAGLDLGIHAAAPNFSAEVKRATQDRGANVAIDTV